MSNDDVIVEIATPLPLSVSAEVLNAFGARWPGTVIEPGHHALRLRIPAAEVHTPQPDPAGPVDPIEHVGYVDATDTGLSFMLAEDLALDLANTLGPIAQAMLTAYDTDTGAAINYAAFSLYPQVHDGVDERIEIIVQRVSGLTPADKATLLIDRLTALCDAAETGHPHDRTYGHIDSGDLRDALTLTADQ